MTESAAQSAPGASAGLSKSQLKKLAKKNGEVSASVAGTSSAGDEDNKKVSPMIDLVTKRSKAIGKKLQRIATMEKLDNINADQQKTIAGKAALEGAQKELNDLLVAISTLEFEQSSSPAKPATTEAATANTQTETLPILLQFLHLASLVLPDQRSGFAPPVLPPALQKMTAQDVAAIGLLREQIINGPLFGGHGDAMECIQNLAVSKSDVILQGVTYGRILFLIEAMTLPPGADDASANGFNFMGSSEIETSSAKESSNPTLTVEEQTEQLGDYVEVAPAAFADVNSAANGVPKSMSMSWADEVEAEEAAPAVELPAIPAEISAESKSESKAQKSEVPVAATPAQAPEEQKKSKVQIDDDGFETVRTKKRPVQAPSKSARGGAGGHVKGGPSRSAGEKGPSAKTSNGGKNGNKERAHKSEA